MCPACLASLTVLLSGGLFSAFLAVKSIPLSKSSAEPEGEEDEASADRLAG